MAIYRIVFWIAILGRRSGRTVSFDWRRAGMIAFLPASTAACFEAPAPALPALVPELDRPLLASVASGPLAEVRVVKTGEVRLEFPETLPRRRGVKNLRLSSDSILFNDGQEAIWQFDRTGGFLRRLRELPTPGEFIKRPRDVLYSAIHDRLFVATPEGTLVFRRDGSLEKRLTPLYCHGLAELADGTLLINTSRREGPYWTALDPDDLRGQGRTFYLQRRKLPPPGKDWLSGHSPHSRAEIDSQGNVYVVATGLREIRKYDRNLNYIGDFRMQEDPDLIPPPEKLSPEQAADMEMGRRPRYSVVFQTALVGDEFLILQYVVPGAKDLRLHFYRLDGAPAFSQIWWNPPILGSDEAGRIYAGRRGPKPPPHSLILDVYEFGGESTPRTTTH